MSLPDFPDKTPETSVVINMPPLGDHPTGAKNSSRARYMRILAAGLSAIISKGAVVIANLISVPIVVRYLGPVQFGIWATLSTSLSLLLVLDLGIANTLTNFISEAYARDDRNLASVYASTAFWLMMAIATMLGILGLLAWPFIDWGYIFHINDATRDLASRSVAVAYVVFLIGMPMGLAPKLLGGYQELRSANLFAAAGSLGSLISVILAVRFHCGLPVLVGVSTGALISANGICLLWTYFHHKPWLRPWPQNFSLAASRRLLRSGNEFFLIQLAGLVVFNSDNLVIAHFIGPANVTPYNITWRLVGYAAVLQTLLLPALWPAYSEAFVRGDLGWVRKAFRRVMISTMVIAFFCCGIFLFAGQFLIRAWAGKDAVPSLSLLFLMCVWVLISTFMNNVACVLVAASETRVQAWSSVIAAIVNLGLSLWLVRTMGSIGVILATIISYLVVLVGPQVWNLIEVLNRPSKLDDQTFRECS